MPDVLVYPDSEANRAAGIVGLPRKPPVIGQFRDLRIDACSAYLDPKSKAPVPPLDDRTRDILLEWGICKRCRCSRDHKADACGNNKPQHQ